MDLIKRIISEESTMSNPKNMQELKRLKATIPIQKVGIKKLSGIILLTGMSVL